MIGANARQRRIRPHLFIPGLHIVACPAGCTTWLDGYGHHKKKDGYRQKEGLNHGPETAGEAEEPDNARRSGGGSGGKARI